MLPSTSVCRFGTSCLYRFRTMGADVTWGRRSSIGSSGRSSPRTVPLGFQLLSLRPKDDDTHPRKMVLNAFTRRGGVVIATQGTSKVYWGGFPVRAGYVDADVLGFASRVEQYD